MKRVAVALFVVWALCMGAMRVYSLRLERLPLELRNTSQDPEEVCINGQCEAEQD